MNRREATVINQIDRRKKLRFDDLAQNVVSGFMRQFDCPDERERAALALVDATAPVLMEACGATRASTRLSMLSGVMQRAPSPPYPGGRR